MLLSRHPLYTFAEAVPRPEGQYSVLSYIIPKIDVCWAEELVYFGYNTKSDTHPKFPNRTPARYPYADEYSLVLVGECLSYVFPRIAATVQTREVPYRASLRPFLRASHLFASGHIYDHTSIRNPGANQ